MAFPDVAAPIIGPAEGRIVGSIRGTDLAGALPALAGRLCVAVPRCIRYVRMRAGHVRYQRAGHVRYQGAQMSSEIADAKPTDLPKVSSGSAVVIHPRWVRITHWINVIAMFVMITSGWRIYDASPLFGFIIPPVITIGDGLDGLSGALLWHFAAMWLLVINGVVYLAIGFVSGRFRRKLLPIRPAEVLRDLGAALAGRLSHDDLSSYNAVQRLLYLGVIAAGVVVVLSGISI